MQFVATYSFIMNTCTNLLHQSLALKISRLSSWYISVRLEAAAAEEVPKAERNDPEQM